MDGWIESFIFVRRSIKLKYTRYLKSFCTNILLTVKYSLSQYGIYIEDLAGAVLLTSG